MTEFIVWDNDLEKFINEKECVFFDGTLFRNCIDFENMISDDLTMFSYIGKTDINEKKIYADSSIVEFNYENIKQYGYFSFDDTVLAYVIKLFNSKQTGISAYLYSKFTIENIKIIDTIQENKFNLFKNTP